MWFDFLGKAKLSILINFKFQVHDANVNQWEYDMWNKIEIMERSLLRTDWNYMQDTVCTLIHIIRDNILYLLFVRSVVRSFFYTLPMWLKMCSRVADEHLWFLIVNLARFAIW